MGVLKYAFDRMLRHEMMLNMIGCGMRRYMRVYNSA